MLTLLSCLVASAAAQHYSATYLPSNAPPKSENGQTGTNQCGTDSSQTSTCQNAYVNSVEDFCLFAPPEPGAQSTIGDTERIEVSWCTQPGHGTRVMPPGTITGAHFVLTPDYVQITGVGDLTKLNIPPLDAGGELDPHGADGNGNPVGGLVFSTFGGGDIQQAHEWTNFMGYNEFCFRACKDGPNAPQLCQHIYDVLGCDWNMPANYDAGSFEDCVGDDALPMGIYGSSTFHQGDPSTPPPHPVPSSSQCKSVNTIGGTVAVTTTGASATTTSTGNSGTVNTSSGSSVTLQTQTSTTSTGSTTASTGSTTSSGTATSKATTSSKTGTSTTGTSTTTTTSGATVTGALGASFYVALCILFFR